jgi:hypothetical protein
MALPRKRHAWPVVPIDARALLLLALAGAAFATSARAAQPTTTVPTPPNPANSAWDEPALIDPTVVTINDSKRNLKLDQAKDYILECQPGAVRLSWPLVVWGGHNVVFQDCHLEVTRPNWSAAFKDQTGTLWVHDVRFGGRHLNGGVQLQEPAATVVMRDVLFDRVYGSYATNHAECVQSWAGPSRLLIDGLTCPTTYQGLFLLPNQFDSGPAPRIFDLRHVDIDDSRGAVALWLGDVKGGLSAMRLNLQDVYVVPNRRRLWRGWWLWPALSWRHVIAGAPSGGPYVHSTRYGATGVDEAVSPVPTTREIP